MEFYTKVACRQLPPLQYSDRLICLGSCFADRIGARLHNAAFRVVTNPCGVLFNPLSIQKSISRALDNDCPLPSLQHQDGLWVSTDYHSSLAAPTHEEALARIVTANQTLCSALSNAQWLIVTFGTAWVYRTTETGDVVANCHHFPQTDFKRELLTTTEIVTSWQQILSDLEQHNPALKCLFTVSPVRHLRDGMQDNSVSKATLLLAIHELLRSVSNAYYFPSYEIMLDELRDYRFYNPDLLQPNTTALEYIEARLQESWFAPATTKLYEQVKAYRAMCQHQPRNIYSPSYATFLARKAALGKALQSQLPEGVVLEDFATFAPDSLRE